MTKNTTTRQTYLQVNNIWIGCVCVVYMQRLVSLLSVVVSLQFDESWDFVFACICVRIVRSIGPLYVLSNYLRITTDAHHTTNQIFAEISVARGKYLFYISLNCQYYFTHFIYWMYWNHFITQHAIMQIRLRSICTLYTT